MGAKESCLGELTLDKNNSLSIVIIGAGAIGCAIARELSRFKVNITVLEKESDVAFGTSGRNSAVVHAGFNNKPGSLMARLCVEGNEGFESICTELDVPFKNTGKVLVAHDDEDLKVLGDIVEQGETNGCKDLKLIDAEELKRLVPNVEGIGGMYSPHTSIFDPFSYCIALAENAASNGAKFFFDEEVIGIERKTDNSRELFVINTDSGSQYIADVLINCAGLYADKISEMVGIEKYKIYPCKGEYFILDKVADDILDTPVYPVPKPGIGGLGVHLTPTIDGNIIIGPSAEYLEDKDDYACTSNVMEKLLSEAKTILPLIDKRLVIGNYAGIRPKQAAPDKGGFQDFVIKDEEGCPNFINLIGIESPGLTASVPIAKMVCDIIMKNNPLIKNDDFDGKRISKTRFRELSEEEQMDLIKENPEYGEIICRCQKVTKKEIRDAIENPLGAKSITSIKYRAWATTGRCNGGYCLSKIVDMLVNEYGFEPENIKYRSSGSEMFTGRIK